jgi:hypothetical protein
MNTKQNKSSVPISTIIYTTIGAVIIVAGVTAILRLSKLMVADMNEMGL